MLGDGGGELRERFVVKLLTGLGAVGFNFRNREGNGLSLLLYGVFGKQNLQALAEASFFAAIQTAPFLEGRADEAARRPGYLLPHSSLASAS